MSMSNRFGKLAGLGLVVAACIAVLTPSAAFAAATPDRTAPSTPTNLHVQTLQFTWLTLAWDASTDNSGSVMAYDAEVQTPSGLLQERAFATSQSFGGLAAGTTYTASVRAVDAAGNRSAPVSVQFTTPTRTLPPPTTPTNLRGVYVDGTLTGIAWDPSTHGTAVSYVLRSGDNFVHSTSSTSVTVFELVYVDCALSLGGTYTLTVQAWSADNDMSALSAPLTVTIPLTVPVR